MADNDWIHIESWMGKRLGLRGNYLLCFALIHGYSRYGNGYYARGAKHIMEMLFCSEVTALACLEKLTVMQLIRKVDAVIKGHKRCLYISCVTFENGELVCENDTKETLVGQTKETLVGQTKETLVYNIENNIINKIKEKKEKRLSNDNQKKEEYSDDFLRFWKAYGYSKDKVTTYRRWNKLSEKDKKAALAALPAYFADCERCKRDKRYPAVYLNKRTWEDDFTSPEDKEEKEETQAVEIPAADIEPWARTQEWMKQKTPRLAPRIDYLAFARMRGMVMFKGDIFADILVEIEQSGFDGDIVAEFDRLSETEKYSQRRWA